MQYGVLRAEEAAYGVEGAGYGRFSVQGLEV